VDESLDAVKDNLRRSFLGKGGIHGLGLSRAKQAIRVYLKPSGEAAQSQVVARLRESAKPFDVIVVEEEPPKAS
jgi:hypothetical protein